MRGTHRNRKNCIPGLIIGIAGIVICFTCISAETVLVILAVLLIVLGLWLLLCG